MVAILLANGFETVEALAPADVLTRAGADVMLVSLDGQEVVSAQDVTVQPPISILDIDADVLDMLVLPGGGVGTENLKASKAVRALVLDCAKKNIPIGAICAAPTLLGGLGLLKGRRAVCFPAMKDELVAAGAGYAEGEGVVRDGQFITGRAAGSSLDFGLVLAEVLFGREKAEAVCAQLYYTPSAF